MHRQATRRRNLPAAFCLCFRRAAPPSLYTILWDQAAKFLRVRGRCQTISKGRHAIAVSALPPLGNRLTPPSNAKKLGGLIPKDGVQRWRSGATEAQTKCCWQVSASRRLSVHLAGQGRFARRKYRMTWRSQTEE